MNITELVKSAVPGELYTCTNSYPGSGVYTIGKTYEIIPTYNGVALTTDLPGSGAYCESGTVATFKKTIKGNKK